MSGGRIRSIKPELLEDEDACALPDEAWRLWIASWCIADDWGNLRAGLRYLAATVFQDTTKVEVIERALQILTRPKRPGSAPFLALYLSKGEIYAHITNWEVHQRIVNPSKPRVPTPSQGEALSFSAAYDQSLKKITKPLEPFLETTPHARALDLGNGNGSGGGGGGQTAIADRKQAEATASVPESPAGNSSHHGGPEDLLKTPKAKGAKKTQAGPSTLELAALSEKERDVLHAIEKDDSLVRICRDRPRLAQDLCRSAPLVDLPVEIAALGSWLRANPSRAKKDGNSFLLRNIGRKQSELSEKGAVPREPKGKAPPQALPLKPPQAPPPRAEIAERAAAIKAGQQSHQTIQGAVAGVGASLSERARKAGDDASAGK